MLNCLAIEDARAIAEAAARRARDERAMVAYLGIGRRTPRSGPPDAPLVLPAAADLAAFDSAERRRLGELVAALSPEARQELLALVWLGAGTRPDYASALARARRMPVGSLTGYLLGRRLERHIPAGLAKLGLTV